MNIFFIFPSNADIGTCIQDTLSALKTREQHFQPPLAMAAPHPHRAGSIADHEFPRIRISASPQRVRSIVRSPERIVRHNVDKSQLTSPTVRDASKYTDIAARLPGYAARWADDILCSRGMITDDEEGQLAPNIPRSAAQLASQKSSTQDGTLITSRRSHRPPDMPSKLYSKSGLTPQGSQYFKDIWEWYLEDLGRIGCLPKDSKKKMEGAAHQLGQKLYKIAKDLGVKPRSFNHFWRHPAHRDEMRQIEMKIRGRLVTTSNEHHDSVN
ncbi:hypothetical protein BKA62DRAFT_711605 [Auriculariales sp. MPI-PUGE-AT-0066]|nr:hypothetical protein BKA62DRAFT_711605 [Auriculariales sp. MPI-PUGE-AT-0066]